MSFLDIQFVGPCIAGLFSLAVGVFTFFADRKNATHWYFFAVTIVIAIWAFTIAIFHISIGPMSSLWWNLHWIAGLFLAPTTLLALQNFPAREIRIGFVVRFLVWAGSGLMAFVVILSPEKFIQYYIVSADAIPEAVVGPFAWLYEIYFGSYLVIGVIALMRTFAGSYGRRRAQIAAGMTGHLIGTMGASFTNLILPIHFGLELIWLGPIFGVIGIASFSYMLFGIQGSKGRLFPIFILGLAVFSILVFQVFSAPHIESIILNGAILSGVLVLVIFLVRDTLLEAADLSRLQGFSERLQRANENLRRADRVKSEFLAIVSHHLRTPLTHIKWALTELAEGSYGKKLTKEQQKLTKELLENNERLVNFIESFMDTSRIETGKMFLKKEEVYIDTVIQELVEKMEDRAKHYYRVNMERLPSTEEIPPIVGDGEALKRVFESILGNALIYNKPSGKVYIKVEKEDKYVKVEITDTGIGITPKSLRRIGEKFFRSPLAKKHVAEGTGLGVFIAKHTVKLHKGSLEIQSAKGEGTTVTILLPIKV
jgi:signal transduction histidine kinase